MSISQQQIEQFQQRLTTHPIYNAIDSVESLRIFMQHHIYSVWDFMSLIKYLQNAVAPTQVPWIPGGDSDVRRFINELTMEEESDLVTLDNGEQRANSHFELYVAAMEEVGADTAPVHCFIQQIGTEGLDAALNGSHIPAPSRQFSTTTFEFINSGRSYEVAAALALGREHIIPCMFRKILAEINVSEQQAPMFHYYLNRHIHLDEDFHAPLSLRLLNGLCHNEEQERLAVEAAEKAIDARVEFWDGVLGAIQQA